MAKPEDLEPTIELFAQDKHVAAASFLMVASLIRGLVGQGYFTPMHMRMLIGIAIEEAKKMDPEDRQQVVGILQSYSELEHLAAFGAPRPPQETSQ